MRVMNTGIDMRCRLCPFLLAVLLVLAAAAYPPELNAQGLPGELTATGSVKEWVLASRSVITDDPWHLSLTRARVQLATAPATWQAEAWFDAEFRAGSFLETPDAAFADQLAAATRVQPLVDLTTSRRFSDQAEGRLSVFRATLTREGERARVSVGRQRIAWGSGMVWNPTDLFNPQPPTAIERDERAAVDAVRVAVPLGVVTGLDVVLAPVRDLERGRYAARYRGHIGEYDVAVSGGVFDRRWVGGVDVAGYVRNAGVRAEAAVDDAARLRATLNADYTFRNGVYIIVEGHYNGGGDAAYMQDRYYTAVIASKSVHPLVSVSMYAIQNLEDGSGLIGPSVAASVRDNLDLTLSTYVLHGGGQTEFGAGHGVWFGGLQFWW